MPITSDNYNLKFQTPCAERLPCGRCKLTMGMCPEDQPYTITWTTMDADKTKLPIEPYTNSSWESSHTVDPNSDAFKKLMS